MDNIKTLESKQTQWAILRYTHAFPKFINLFKTIPYRYLMDFILEVDKLTKNMVSYVLETPLTKENTIQVRLPMFQGGLGIMVIQTNIEAIKTASWNQIFQRAQSIMLQSKIMTENQFNNSTNERNLMRNRYIDKIGNDVAALLTIKQ